MAALIKLRRPIKQFCTSLAWTPTHACETYPEYTRNPGTNPKGRNGTLLGRLIGLCRPSGLKCANLSAVRCSSNPPYSFAPETTTARSTVRVEAQPESHFKPHMHVIPERKIIPVGFADGESTAPVLPSHVRPRHCAVLRFLRLPRCFLM